MCRCDIARLCQSNLLYCYPQIHFIPVKGKPGLVMEYGRATKMGTAEGLATALLKNLKDKSNTADGLATTLLKHVNEQKNTADGLGALLVQRLNDKSGGKYSADGLCDIVLRDLNEQKATGG